VPSFDVIVLIDGLLVDFGQPKSVAMALSH
jgi:hypothetical protein